MTVFADSSAVVKLYVDEEHTEKLEELSTTVISAVCRVEVPSAIWRKARIGELTEAAASILVRDFEFDLAGTPESALRFVALDASIGLLERAAGLVPIHDLKSLDAIQLASAIAARELDPRCGTFACFDKSLSRAAAAHGFRLISSI